MRKEAKASGRVWLSQVLGSGDWSIVAPPGMPDAGEWKRIVEQGMKKRSGGGRKPPPVLDADRRTTPGCVRSGDVVARRHDTGKMRLWELRRSTAVEAVLVRLQQRRRLTDSAVKGDRVTVRCGGGACRPPVLSFFRYLRGVCATLVGLSEIPHIHRTKIAQRPH